ncbi:hypothetical protein HUU53_00330 [Candidatus Micrarchaeota archaeon]|nr:hypothetical protein [Candidatus Micrarchaeota archaeon]
MPLIVCSSQNELGLNAFNLLQEKKANCLLLEENALYSKKQFETDLVVYCYTHKSSSNEPCFTTHSQGNFSEAKLGGEEKTLANTSGTAVKLAYTELLKQTNLPVFLEATHHGPTSLHSPSLFIELGATPKQWTDLELLNNLTSACISVAEKFKPTQKAVLGFGGTHYCNAFLELAKKESFSFICSKHYLDFIDAEMIEQMVSKTIEPVTKAFVDKKGCSGEQRRKIISLLEEKAIECELV